MPGVTVPVGIKPDPSGFAQLRQQAREALENVGVEGGVYGERRVEMNAAKLVSDLARAQSPMDALLVVAERMHGIFRLGLGIGIAVKAGMMLKEQLEKTAEEAQKLYDGLEEVGQLDVHTASIEQLQDGLKKALDLSKEAAREKGFWHNLFFGKYDAAAISEANAQVARYATALDHDKAEQISQETSIIDLQIQGRMREAELAKITLEYEEKIAKAKKEQGGSPEQVAALEAQKQEALKKAAQDTPLYGPAQEQFSRKAEEVAQKERDIAEAKMSLKDREADVQKQIAYWTILANSDLGTNESRLDAKAKELDFQKKLLEVQKEIAEEAKRDDEEKKRTQQQLDEAKKRVAEIRDRVEDKEIDLLPQDDQVAVLKEKLKDLVKVEVKKPSTEAEFRVKEERLDTERRLKELMGKGDAQAVADNLARIGGGGYFASKAFDPTVSQLQKSNELLADIRDRIEAMGALE